MLSKNNRLIKNKDFELVSKKGKSLADPFIVIKWIKNNLSYSRFGIIVSLKVDKRSPRRNKIKRRLREIIRNNLSKIETGYDFLIISRVAMKDQNFDKIQSSFLSLLNKINLYDNKVDSS